LPGTGAGAHVFCAPDRGGASKTNDTEQGLRPLLSVHSTRLERCSSERDQRTKPGRSALDLLAYLRAILEPTAEATKPASRRHCTFRCPVRAAALLFKRKQFPSSTEVGWLWAYSICGRPLLFCSRLGLALGGSDRSRSEDLVLDVDGAGAHAPAVRPVQRKGTERVLDRAGSATGHMRTSKAQRNAGDGFPRRFSNR
jgi:hypothetical protein